jgi:hypothetical protein
MSGQCVEPEGDELAWYGELPPGWTGTETKHDVMLDQTGQCPWCGETDE